MADIGGDRRQDLCARGVSGLSCRITTDDGFEAVGRLDDFTNDQNWDQMKYYSTLRIGSGECLPEQCNGFDDDCDGEVDEGVCTSGSDVGSGSDAGSGADAGSVGKDTGFSDIGGDMGSDAGHSDAGGGGFRGSNSLGGKAGCAVIADSPGRSTPTPLALLFGLPFLLFWRARSSRRQSLLACAAVVSLVLIGGCDAPENTKAPATTTEHAQRKAEVGSFEPIDSDKRLLGVYAGWQLRGHMQPVSPRSDAPPRFATELSYDGELKTWPLEDEFVTNAVFVPGDGSRQKPAALALRMPDARLVLVDLEDDSVTELDGDVGFSVAAAADGCCLAYMKGDMGFQSTLRVLDLGDGQHRDVQLDQNGWSPAISPSGDKVAYVAPSREGQAALYLHDLGSDRTSRLDVADEAAFPAGPQPPFWTERGIAFAAERGAYLMAPAGEIIASAPGVRGLVVDLKTGRIFDGSGEPVSLVNE
jgi:hypothetical protein